MKGDKYFVLNNEKAPEDIRGKIVVEQYRLKYCTCVKDCKGGYYKVSNKCLMPQIQIKGHKGYLLVDRYDKVTGLTITMLVPNRNKKDVHRFYNITEEDIKRLSQGFKKGEK